MKVRIDPLPRPKEGSTRAYGAGFAIAVALTIGAFLVTWAYRSTQGEIFSRGVFLGLLAALAIVQLITQSLFFLHLSAEKKARLTLISGIFTVMVVLCIVLGSLWIMQNLNYHMMPEDPIQYIETKEAIKR